jgi:hypothetical protein
MKLTLREIKTLFKDNGVEYMIKNQDNGVAQINLLYKVETAK